jgi:UDP-glucose 6-dehydrogenase
MGVQRLNLRPRERVGVYWHTGNIVIPLLAKKSIKTLEMGLRVCMNPKFTRETTVVHDFEHPPLPVYRSPGSAD